MDHSPFDDFYRDEFAWAVRLAFLIAGDRPTAEDVAQDAFVAVQPHFASLDAPKAYLRVTIVRLARRAARRTTRRRSAEQAPAEDGTFGQPPFAGVELLDAIDRLPVRQRAVLVLRYFDGLSESEIGAVLGCRPGTVKSLSSRAIATLRKEVEP